MTTNYSKLIERLFTIVVPHSSFENALDAIDYAMRTSGHYGNPSHQVIVGESRTGKSRVAAIGCSRYPRDRKNGKAIIPMLSVALTKSLTSKGLVTNILDALGSPLLSSGTEYQRELLVVRLLREVNVHVMHVDESQHLYDERSRKVNYDMADTLKRLADNARLNLVMTGLPEVLSVISSNSQLVNRSCRPIELTRFDWLNQKHRQEFMEMIIGFYEGLVPLEFPDFETPGHFFRWYCACGGLPGLIVKILFRVIIKCESDNRLFVRLSDLDDAHYAVTFRNGISKSWRPFSENFLDTPNEVNLKEALKVKWEE